MSGFKSKDMDNRRRQLLLGSIALGATGLLHAVSSVAAVTTPSAIPSNVVNLSDFGGVPGASPAAIISAFNQAFTRIKSLGGGTLNIAAGTYDLGNQPVETTVIGVSDLRNVLISAYGAKLVMNTTASSGMPVFLNFQNPNNVTIAGLSFYDYGTNLNINWKGAVCISVNTTVLCSGFKTIDCLAENVGTFWRSMPSVRYTLENADINGTVRTAYYGVNANYNGRYSKCNLVCDRVRRGFIAYGARNWDVKVSCNHVSGGLGSNGFIDLIPDGSSVVTDCTIDLTVTGSTSPYGALIHFYHQYDEKAPQYMRNVKSRVKLNNATGSGTVFLFDHETTAGVQPSTIRTWEQMELTGEVIGTYAGLLIRNPSISTGTTNLIRVASNLASLQNMSALPKYFQVFTPSQCSA